MSARAAHERRPASPEKSLQRASWERLGSLSRPLGVLSGASWGVLEVSWGALGTLRASSGRLGSLRGLLEASWKPLGGLLTTKILPKNPDRGPKTVQEAPKSLLFSTTPWEWPTELKSVTLLFQVVHWIFAPSRKNGPLNFGQFYYSLEELKSVESL